MPNDDNDAKAEATQWLRRLGYWKGRDRVGSLAIDNGSNIEPAVRDFQRQYGLPETGELDLATIGWLTRPGCGSPDEFAMPFKLVEQRKWPRNNLTFFLGNAALDMTRAQALTAIRWAFDQWSNVTPLRFNETAAGADLKISFAGGDHSDGFPFNGKAGELAHAFPPGDRPTSGNIHFDLAENWSVNAKCPPDKFDLYNVALHEIGHALGLRHSTSANSIMFEKYQGPQRHFHRSDVVAIQRLYGAPA